MKIFRISIHDKLLKFSENDQNLSIYDRKEELLKNKCKIDTFDHQRWEISKKKNNDYEYIYTSSKRNQNICNIVPVSRSYFKLHEMILDFNLLKDDIYCACLAEGPGGFIHCLNDHIRNSKIKINKIYGITLIEKKDKKIPYWNQIILNNSHNSIISGKDKTGDLYNHENVIDFIKNIGMNHCHLVTADGGFDYSSDYNSQEQSSYKLLYSEIFTTLHIQKIDGNFILKVFDLFHHKTIQLLYLLYNHYSIIEIYKPSTSRTSNSEKYIVCSQFLGCSKHTKDILTKYFDKCENLYIDVPESFIIEINKYNDKYINKQMKIIDTILSNTDMENKPTQSQISVAMKWCELYKLPINEKCIYLN
jgi:23S rRNA U2552 (ribose-2'-O)-methylase RlmE/FtsJ